MQWAEWELTEVGKRFLKAEIEVIIMIYESVLQYGPIEEGMRLL
jgi:hypothetical protein